MMMLGLQLTNQAPFHTVYLSGLIRDPEGRKMSKTKGNVVDPLGVIDESGADALRFAVVHGAAAGQDQRFGPAKLENARNFANKLWNATRFVVGARPASIDPDGERQPPDPRQLGPAERWMLSRANATVDAVDRAMADYAFGEVTRLLYDAIWNEFCDWGLEFAKVRLADDELEEATREGTWWALVEALDTYLRLLHPVMPFVTEALWAAIPHRSSDPALLIVARWPGSGPRDAGLEDELDAVIGLVRGVRNARAEAGIEPRAWLPTEVSVPAPMGPTFEVLRPAIERLTHARPLQRRLTREALGDGAQPVAGGALSVISGELEAIVHRPTDTADPAAGAAERARLERELGEAERHLSAARARLANDEFMAKAPDAVVAGARARETALAEQVDRLRDRLDATGGTQGTGGTGGTGGETA
jgi:valyl-tRNA synthetase